MMQEKKTEALCICEIIYEEERKKSRTIFAKIFMMSELSVSVRLGTG
jgi:hypothetical protein